MTNYFELILFTAPLQLFLLCGPLVAKTAVYVEQCPHSYSPQYRRRWQLALSGGTGVLFANLLPLITTYFMRSAVYYTLLCWSIIMVAAACLSTALIYWHRNEKLYRNSLCVFWILSILAEFTIGIYQAVVDSSTITATWWLYLILGLLISLQSMLLWLINSNAGSSAAYERLNSFGQESFLDQTDTNNHCPQETASFFQLLTFAWINPLMKLGRKRPLDAADLWECSSEYRASVISKQFQRIWEREQELHPTRPSLLRALLRAFGREYAFSGLLKLCQDCLQFVQPNLLSMLIAFVSHYSDSSPDRPALSVGFLIVSAMPIAACAQSFLLHQYFHRCMVVGMKVRSAIITAIYRKALRLSNSSRQKYTVGEIVNLMSVDAQRFLELASYLHIIWSSPIQISLALYFLYQTMGWSIFGGLVVMALMIPINAVLATVESTLEEHQMVNKDNRIKLVDEFLNGIKALKLYAWESHFLDKIKKVRENELQTLKKIGYINAIDTFTWSCTPFLVAFATFAVHTLIRNQPLSPVTVFVAISLFNLLQFPLSMLPYMISSVVEAKVSLYRIFNFLVAEELEADAVQYAAQFEFAVKIADGNFYWSPPSCEAAKDDFQILKNINLSVPQGVLLAVVGKVGAGKSSLLSAILGEMYKDSKSKVLIGGTLSYVGQQAWIMNSSIRDNILFGRPFDKNFYLQTIDACSLDVDIQSLPGGDLAEVGERGINLSGGQKQRISLARAVYSQKDIYLLDDPLSAVDATVGRQILDRVIGRNGLLAGKTRILVTHAIHLLPETDLVMLIKDGRIVEGPDPLTDFPAQSEIQRIFRDHTHSRDDLKGKSDKETKKDEPRKLPNISADQTVIETEAISRGSVSFDVYAKYAKSSSLVAIIVSLLLIFAANGANVGANFWLKNWADRSSEIGNTDLIFYLGVYAALGLLMSVFVIAQVIIIWVFSAIRSARILHDQMLESISAAKLQFFDVTPIGRIVNRFSKDIYIVDEVLPRSFLSFFRTLFSVLSILAVICITAPMFVIAVFPIGLLYYYIQRYYLSTSRELKRLESVSRSPMFAHFSQTLAGVETIRAYGKTDEFSVENECKIDENQRAYYPSFSSNRWLAIRLEFLGSLVIFLSAMLFVVRLALFETLDPGVVGLSISYAMTITQTLNWMVRQFCEIETNIVAVERLKEYIDLHKEGSVSDGAHAIPDEWPERGSIEFRGFSARYREGLDLALRDLTLSVESGEKIGVVGRTGAGKSSMTLALFRIVEASTGNISIDGINIANVGLHRLRSSITIIPQDPVLFGGSIRENLDPSGLSTDQELWQALHSAHLGTLISELPQKLDFRISQGGENFSVGQRQLICLARALLRRSKVLILDEATAAIDAETDSIIQKTLKREFHNLTVITIAHRLNTVMDSDRILVLDHGKLAEYDRPDALLSDPSSSFSMLVSNL